MINYKPPPHLKPETHPDLAMEVYLMHGDDGNIYVLHDRAFQKELSWIEYNASTGQMDFIMEDGDLRDFGILIDASFGNHLQTIHTIPVAEIENGHYKDGNYFPLITRTE